MSFFKNSATGAVYYWLMDGYTVKAEGYLWSGGNSGYRVFAIADLNGDGTPDLLVQDTATGNVARWLLNADGKSIASMAWIYTLGLTDWNAVCAADLDGDGSVRMLLQNKTNGVIYYWNLVDGMLGTSGNLSYSTPVFMELKGFADLTGDGRPEALLQSKTDGGVYYLPLNGTSFVSPSPLYTYNIMDWNLVLPK